MQKSYEKFVFRAIIWLVNLNLLGKTLTSFEKYVHNNPLYCDFMHVSVSASLCHIVPFEISPKRLCGEMGGREEKVFICYMFSSCLSFPADRKSVV